jgi:LacI family transcriptional regulator
MVTLKRTGQRRRSTAVTIRTVAEQAGVSMMTVSNVINGTGKFSDQTRASVRQAIRETGYVPNYEARRLASGGSSRIALLYSNHQTPFLAQVLLAAINASTAFGAQLLVRSSNSPTKRSAEKLVLNAARSGVQGLLLVPPYAELLVGSAVLSELKATAIAAAGPLPGMHTVRIDNRSAARELTTFLIRLGHRRIGFISGPPTHGDSLERRAGYLDALRKAGIPLRVALAREGDFTFESGRVAARHILDLRNRPTAIVASNDDMASGVLWAAQQRRLELPGDLSVAGFDDTPTALKSWPPLTVIRQPIERMVEHGVSLLLDSARAPAMSAPHDVVFGYTFVERASTSAVGARPRRRARPGIAE